METKWYTDLICHHTLHYSYWLHFTVEFYDWVVTDDVTSIHCRAFTSETCSLSNYSSFNPFLWMLKVSDSVFHAMYANINFTFLENLTYLLKKFHMGNMYYYLLKEFIYIQECLWMWNLLLLYSIQCIK